MNAEDAIADWLGRGLDSDGEGRLPKFDAEGQMIAIEVGSSHSLLDSVREMVHNYGVSLAKSLATVTANPASLYSLHRKGRIQVGNDADLVILDANLAALCGGQRVLDGEESEALRFRYVRDNKSFVRILCEPIVTKHESKQILMQILRN